MEEWLAKADPRCSPSPWIPACFPEQPKASRICGWEEGRVLSASLIPAVPRSSLFQRSRGEHSGADARDKN